MVLSNKKLKQRLRAELVESLANSVATTYPNNDGTTGPDPNTRSQLSLKNLLHSASQRPRLSKREKRRKSLPFQVPEAVKGRSGSGNSEESKGDEEERKGDEGEKEGGSEGLGEKKKKRKRKREQRSKGRRVVFRGQWVVKDSKQSKKKKKKKKKKEEKEG
ncbi:hypothetical protein CJ030_MR3G014640 [Morella rubra]|uniref:Uncharacterized protein n=1 Tax=Morella rubra TaxID=262757 RepID=A0A6A1W566_9ROSI|nr:hypothetical protein CJ030_MR3G014640 [Morella rubra]